MPERGRGKSPGAKGTDYPRASRPQKSIPDGPRGGSRFGGGKGSKPFRSPQPPAAMPPASVPAGKVVTNPPAVPVTRESLAGKTLHLQKKIADAAFAAPERRSGPSGKPLRSGDGKVRPGAGFVRADARREASPERPVSSPKPAPEPRPVRDGNEPVRISKLLAERGLCSRREADAYIERGWVYVDGEPVTELGTKALPSAKLALSPEARSQQNRLMTLLLHKPVGYVSGQPEPGFQPAVVLIQPQNQARGSGDMAFEPRWMKDLAPAGRLDIDSTGLLVLTQDGRIARQLIGEDSAVEKEYLVRVEGRLIANGLALLNHGLALDGKALRPAVVEWLNEDQLRFILREGKKRQIRRMCELVGLTVVGLKRVRMGKIKLGDLPLGQWRYLRPGEAF